ncbi:MAG: hypothetical protein JXR37_36500 [Kiritimatiellae bacterium]|nr:hypothetical protein [Kiritimatiellia bacterium]
MSEVSALLKKTRWSARNLGRVLGRQSRLKIVFISIFAAGLLFGLWLLFIDSFIFLDRLGGMGVMIVRQLFALFFFGLQIMLILSGVVSAYAAYFRSREVPFLLVRPYSMGQIALYKLTEAALFSSWAFFFIIIPFVGAYARYERLGPLFSVWTLVFSVPFLVLCSGVAALLVLVVVRWFPRDRALKWAVLLLAAGVLAWQAYRAFGAARADDVETTVVLAYMIPGLKAASTPLLPSWWVAEGIMALAHGQWLRGLLLWLVLLANVLLVCLLVDAIGRAVFFDAWQKAVNSGRRPRRANRLFGALRGRLLFLPGDIRAMVMKDVRTFFRDATQWLQVLIFFGLLGLYYTNLRAFHYHLLAPEWKNMIAFLNVFSVAAVLCSLGSRFAYPQLSLEGQGFWTIGLAPTTMSRVLLTKFLMSLLGMLTVSTLLLCVSIRMLQVDAVTVWATLALGVAVSCAVSGLSTGLGAVFLDLKQKNPSAIVSGFGGTLNLVMSLVFMLGAILPYGVLFHLHARHPLSLHDLYRGAAAATGWLALLTFGTTAVPLYLGQRSLRRREY